MIAVGHNNCTSTEDQAFTYEVIGPATYYLGEGDLHDRDFDDFEVIVNLDYHTHSEFMEMPGTFRLGPVLHVYSICME